MQGPSTPFHHLHHHQQQQIPQQGATVILPPSSLLDTAVANRYFTTLLSPVPLLPPDVLLSWLAGPAEFFATGGGSVDDCANYLRCISTHANILVEIVLAKSGEAEGHAVAVVVKAAGKAATKCRDDRSRISSSGIITTLARLATCWELVTKKKKTKKKKNQTSKKSTGKKAEEKKSDDGDIIHDYDDDDDQMMMRALTPYHVELLKCCVLAGQYRFAYSFAEAHPINFAGPIRSMRATLAASAAAAAGRGGGMVPAGQLDPVEAAEAAETYLAYFYYLGNVCIGCEDFELAVHCFRICLSAPSQVVSAIEIAARKKMLLCQCLLVEEFGLAAGASGGVNGGGGGLSGGEGGNKKDKKEIVLELPAASSPCVIRYMSGSSVKGGAFGVNKPGLAAEGPAIATSAGGEQAATAAPSATGGTQDQTISSTVAIVAARPRDNRRDRSKEKNYYHLGRYHDIVLAYLDDNAQHLDVILEDTAELLAYDGNLGLAKRVRDSIAWRNVAKTASVYEVVALEKIVPTDSKSNNMGDITERRKKAEALLLDMLRQGVRGGKKADIKDAFSFGVKIDQESGMVYFPREGDESWDDYDDDYEDEDQVDDMTSHVKECMALAQRIRKLDAALTESGRYQTLVTRDRNARGLGTVGGKAGGEGGAASAAEGGAASGSGSGPRGVAELDRSSPMEAFE